MPSFMFLFCFWVISLKWAGQSKTPPTVKFGQRYDFKRQEILILLIFLEILFLCMKRRLKVKASWEMVSIVWGGRTNIHDEQRLCRSFLVTEEFNRQIDEHMNLHLDKLNEKFTMLSRSLLHEVVIVYFEYGTIYSQGSVECCL